MNVFSEIYQWVQSGLSAASNSSFYTVTLIKSRVNEAYIWAGSLFDWPQLENAKTTSTQAGFNYYDYPISFRSDSIYILEIDGVEYTEKRYDDFLKHKRDNPNDTSEHIFANHGRQFFVFPTPTTTGSNNISAWGTDEQKLISLVNDSDKTIFSDAHRLGNIAVAKQALSILKAKGDSKEVGQVEDVEAKQMLTSVFSKVSNNRQRSQSFKRPMFEVPDYFATNTGSIGNFS